MISTGDQPAVQTRVQQDAPAAFCARKRHAGHLVRINLPPLMGQRDAALEKTAVILGSPAPVDGRLDRESAFAAAQMLADAERDCSKIIGMLNNPDTIARESRLLNNVRILSELATALADFHRLKAHMITAVETDAAGDDESNSRYVTTLTGRMADIGAALTGLLRDAFARYRGRIDRYRDYAVKNLSVENAERYRSAYHAALEQYALPAAADDKCNNQ